MKSGYEVTLTPFELYMGAMVGAKRNIESKKRQLTPGHGISGAGWNEDIEGALGEMAAAKFLNLFWDGAVNTFHRADLGLNLQIRTTAHENGCLIVRNVDPEDDLYVLVVGTSPTFRLVGFLSGAEAKREIFKRDPNGRPAAYFVPQHSLCPIEDIDVYRKAA